MILMISSGVTWAQADSLRNPILYVTQVPVVAKKNTVVSVGGNHRGDIISAPRGGHLMILYPDGDVRNLTREAGFGEEGLYQNTAKAIAVRDPAVHWSGKRALFSMVVGAQNDGREFYWQIYEIVGLGKGEKLSLRRLPGQANKYNNIQPAYTSSDTKVIFVSDRPIDRSPELYPVQDEQGKGATVTGLWELDVAKQSIKLLEHSPSGSFEPFVDSFGRIVFSRWDHLQREAPGELLEAFDYVSEKADAAKQPWNDVFPEPRVSAKDTMGHEFDLFLPWTMNQDGSDLLTMNHLGRHELGPDAKRARRDSNLVDFKPEQAVTAKIDAPTRASSFLQIAERLTRPGTYVATDAVSIAVSAGRLIGFSATPETNPDEVAVTVLSNKGLARDAIYLRDGRLLGSVSGASAPSGAPEITGTYGGSRAVRVVPVREIPRASEPFKLTLAPQGSTDLSTGAVLVAKAKKTEKTGSTLGELWELQPVEVVARERPLSPSQGLPSLEAEVFQDAGVSIVAMKRWLRENDLALVVSRNLTARDENDQQQPYNLYVPGGVSSIKDDGPSYEITNLQFFQGDYIREVLSSDESVEQVPKGRRAVARLMHDDGGVNLPSEIPGSAKIALDGSTAMMVPARRALTWQTTDAQGEPVVRERFWLSFKAGEIRTCTVCHGMNSRDQLGRGEPSNPPLALTRLLDHWKENYPEANARHSPFAAWADDHGIEAGLSRNLDEDADGLSYFEEFVYGDDPNEPWSESSVAQPLVTSIVAQEEGNFVRLSFTRRVLDDVRFIVESANNLETWSEELVFEGSGGGISDRFEVEATEVATGVQRVELTSRTPFEDDPRKYYRIRVQE